MLVSAQTLKFIQSREGCRLQAYRDSAGVWTIGWGSTHIGGKPVFSGQTIVQAQANAQFQMDVMAFQHGVSQLVHKWDCLNGNQQTALVSFAYNEGLNAFKASSLLRHLNAGDLKAAAAEFPMWDYAGGHHVEGLANRRKAERELFERAA